MTHFRQTSAESVLGLEKVIGRDAERERDGQISWQQQLSTEMMQRNKGAQGLRQNSLEAEPLFKTKKIYKTLKKILSWCSATVSVCWCDFVFFLLSDNHDSVCDDLEWQVPYWCWSALFYWFKNQCSTTRHLPTVPKIQPNSLFTSKNAGLDWPAFLPDLNSLEF